MKFLSLLLAASAALAAPTSTVERDASPVDTALEKRATALCGSFGSTTAGPYTFYHNNWGASAASSGSQCTTFNDLSSNTASWSTSWSWAGGATSVKSYSNVALENVGKQISAVSSINSVWKYRCVLGLRMTCPLECGKMLTLHVMHSYTGSNIIADVAYDLWLAPTKGGTNQYEIMVWLAAYGGAGPISSTGSAIATVTIAGYSWKVFKGPNGDTTVFSFVASSTITNFSGDLNLFFKYLVSDQGVSNSAWITSLQAGTEPFTGSSAVMKTSAYTMTVR